MDSSSSAPTDCAIGKRSKITADNGDVSLMTYDMQEEEDFSHGRVALCGRESEFKLLHEAYDRVVKGGSEVILVQGPSGTGKSSLVEEMRGMVTKNDKGYFVSGKFDQLQMGKDPFSAVAAAFSDICDLILQSHQLADIRSHMLESFGSTNSQVLSKVVSNITLLTGETSTYETEESAHVTDDFGRFEYASQLFLKAVASEDHPLLIMLDDLQWSDERSLQLVKTLIRDKESNHILFCLVCRGDEVDTRTSLMGTSGSSPETLLPFTDIQLENLDMDSIVSMLKLMLQMDRGYEALYPLATLFMKKTKGNPEAIVQLLQFLKAKSMLTYCEEKYCWDWNIGAIESEVSDNPSEIIGKKFIGLDAQVQEALLIGAYLGHSFRAHVLAFILFDGQTTKSDKRVSQYTIVSELLQPAIYVGLLDHDGRGSFKFSHDSNQHYIYNYVTSENERELLHLKIGRGLMKLIASDNPGSSPDDLVFLARSNMARASQHIVEDEERIATMKLCIDAAEMAASKACISDSTVYFENAMSLLKETDWTENFDFCIDLYNSYAETQCGLGCYDKCYEALEVVLRKAVTFKDRFRAHHTKLISYVTRVDYPAAIDWSCNKVMPDAGEAMTMKPSTGRIMVEIVRTKVILRKTRPIDFMSLPPMSDERKLAVMHVLSALAIFALTTQQINMFLYCTLRCVRTSIKHGLSPRTATALTNYTLVLRTLGKVDEAYEFGKVSVLLASRYHEPSVTSLCLSTSAIFVNCWREPLSKQTDSCLEAYKSGMKVSSGVAVACFGAAVYVEGKLLLGAPLKLLEQEMRRYAQEAKKFQTEDLIPSIHIVWQCALNLLGRADDPLVMKGEALDETKYNELMGNDADVMGALALQIYGFRFQACLEEWDTVMELLPQFMKNTRDFRGHYHEVHCLADIAMASLALYGRCGEAKYRKIARKYMKKLKVLDDGLVPDAKSLWLLTQAEWMASVEKREDSVDHYDEAIECLKVSKLVFFETMAYQRAMHFTVRRFEMRKARSYWERLIERHTEWGSVAILEWLQATHSNIPKSVRPTYEIKVGSNHAENDEEGAPPLSVPQPSSSSRASTSKGLFRVVSNIPKSNQFQRNRSPNMGLDLIGQSKDASNVVPSGNQFLSQWVIGK